MRAFPRVLLHPLLLLLAACSTPISVQSNHDPDADFSKLKTYTWSARPKSGDPRIDDELLEKRVQTAADRSLQAKGYRRVAKGGDFVIAYRVIATQGQTWGVVYNDHGYSATGWGYLPVQGSNYSREYTVGALVLDVADPGTRTLLWRAHADAEVSAHDSAEVRKDRINEAVHRMLLEFPPKPKR